jgi:hypothetical protein
MLLGLKNLPGRAAGLVFKHEEHNLGAVRV